MLPIWNPVCDIDCYLMNRDAVNFDLPHDTALLETMNDNDRFVEIERNSTVTISLSQKICYSYDSNHRSDSLLPKGVDAVDEHRSKCYAITLGYMSVLFLKFFLPFIFALYSHDFYLECTINILYQCHRQLFLFCLYCTSIPEYC